MDNLSAHKAVGPVRTLLDTSGFAYRHLPPPDSAAIQPPTRGAQRAPR
jgi:hypothetical protein